MKPIRFPRFRKRGHSFRRDGPGRVRERLAKVLLRDLGVVVDPHDLWTQEGFYRSRYHDLARWGTSRAYFTEKGAKKLGVDLHYTSHPFHLLSWDTMTESCRKGVRWVSPDRFEETYNEVSVP
jgi:hypothetical protein